MVTETYQRMGRKLRQHHDALGHKAVGVRLWNAEIRLWMQWDDARGRLRMLMVRHTGRPNLDTARQLAKVILGPDWISAREHTYPDDDSGIWLTVYAQDFDGGAFTVNPPPIRIETPHFVRWYEARALGLALGEQDSGFVDGPGVRYLPG